MKRTTLLLSAVLVFGLLGLLALPRTAESGLFDTLGDIKTQGVLVESDPPAPPPQPSIFDNLQTFTGKVGFMAATSVGNYVCKDAAIKVIPATGFSRGVIHAEGEGADDNANTDALLIRSMPAKVTLTTSTGVKTILIPQVEAERFKAMLGILHAAKLTNRDVTFQVPTVSVPNCPTAFYAAEASFN